MLVMSRMAQVSALRAVAVQAGYLDRATAEIDLTPIAKVQMTVHQPAWPRGRRVPARCTMTRGPPAGKSAEILRIARVAHGVFPCQSPVTPMRSGTRSMTQQRRR